MTHGINYLNQSVPFIEISQEMDHLINKYLKGEVSKYQLEELRQKLNAAVEAIFTEEV